MAIPTPAFGNVEIKTIEELSSLNNLVLVHLWLPCLLDLAVPFENDAEPFAPVEGDSRDGDSDALVCHMRSTTATACLEK